MKYLLDTHTAIWALGNGSDKNLSKIVKSIIENTSNSLFVSIVSAWEIAVKVSIQKLDYDGGVNAFFRQLRENGIKIISVKDSYVECVESLPFIHRDPFDRILIASAKIEDMVILTADKNIRRYDVSCIW